MSMPSGPASETGFDPAPFFGNLLDSTKLVVYLKDINGRYLYVNKRYEEVSGVPADKIVGKFDKDLFSPEVADLFLAQDRKVLAHGQPLEFEETIPLPGGERSFLTEKFVLKTAEGEAVGVGGFCTEITAQSDRQKRVLADTEQKFQRLVEGLTHNYFFYRHGIDGVFTYVSPSMGKVLGYSQTEFKTHFSEFLTDSPGNSAVHANTELTLSGVSPPPYRVEIFHKNGSVHTLEVSEFPIFDSDKNVTGVEGLARDITVEKASLEELRQSEMRFRVLFENSRDGILAADLETGEITLCNRTMCEMLQYSKDELQGRAFTDLHPSDPNAEGSQPPLIESLSEAGAPSQLLRVERKDSYRIWVEVGGARAAINGRTCFLGYYRDMTARKIAEGALKIASERFRAIFEHSSDGILAADMETRYFSMANPKICSMLGYSEDEILGLSVEKIHPPEKLAEIVNYFEMQARGDMKTTPPIPVLRKDGSIFWAEVTVTHIDIEGRSVSLGFFREAPAPPNA
jgi:PAS domain S-box-containing protein